MGGLLKLSTQSFYLRLLLLDFGVGLIQVALKLCSCSIGCIEFCFQIGNDPFKLRHSRLCLNNLLVS